MSDDTCKTPAVDAPTDAKVDQLPTQVSVAAVIADDKRTVTLQFMTNESVSWEAVVDAQSMDAMIRAFDVSRGQMLDPVSFDLEDGKLYPSALNPRWQIVPDSENRLAVL